MVLMVVHLRVIWGLPFCMLFAVYDCQPINSINFLKTPLKSMLLGDP